MNHLVAEAALFPTNRRANVQVFKGRALLQLHRRGEATIAFRSARSLIEKSHTRLVPDELDTYANALLGMGLTYLQRGRHERSATCLRDARAIAPLLALSTVAKIMRASAAQAAAQGDDERAVELLTCLHKFNVQLEEDPVSLAETAASVQATRGRCKRKTANRDVQTANCHVQTAHCD
ncbi:MAG TPA: tetratricopeptide repeat protein, partial [Planctomycetes bacterium]|nr:tetratricopeptide repeat protein [Planctomycetota bacterium]